MKGIVIDRGKPLAEEARTGHNRWHPDIEPIVEVAEGEDVTLETRDACDGYLTPRSTTADLSGPPLGKRPRRSYEGCQPPSGLR